MICSGSKLVSSGDALMLTLISQEAIILGLQGFPKLVSRIRLYTAVRLYTAKALAQLCCLEFRAHKVLLTLESIASHLNRHLLGMAGHIKDVIWRPEWLGLYVSANGGQDLPASAVSHGAVLLQAWIAPRKAIGKDCPRPSNIIQSSSGCHSAPAA